MDLLLTLGHNSSAIGIENGIIINGYEQERLTRIKSSSAFPVDAIKSITDASNVNKILISHWYDDFDFYKKPVANETFTRHYDSEFIKRLGGEVIALGKEFTHHDAHAYSAIAFLESHATFDQLNNDKPFHLIVSDGFGNGQEVISIYSGNYSDVARPNLHLVRRIYGYQNSLGLLYQYATSFCEMKENEDEYKFLGYESHIVEHFNKIQLDYLDVRAFDFVYKWIKDVDTDEAKTPEFDKNYINIEKLKDIKIQHHMTFQNLINNIPGSPDLNVFQKRVVIGYFIQSIIEKIYHWITTTYNIESAVVTGGLHYNVKLNNSILNSIPGFFCVMPLAGDQGAALGIYRKFIGKINLDTLLIGERYPTKFKHDSNPYIEYPSTQEELVDKVSKHVAKGGIAEIVCGKMEFGPRALCNTSTIAIPYQNTVDFINTINGRNTVMPMAPIIKDTNISYFFSPDQYEKVIGSDRYMIVTYDYKIKVDEMYEGIMHKYPLKNVYSGRPQIVDDINSYAYQVLDKVEALTGCKALVNTSYNVHGKPIIYSTDDAIEDFNFQLNKIKTLNLDTNKVKLFIGK